MLTRLLILIAVLSQLTACMSIPQTRSLAEPAVVQHVKSLPRYSTHANVYIQRPYSVRFENYYDVFIDDKQVTQLRVGQMTALKAAPGRYRFRVAEFNPEHKLAESHVSEFELTLREGSQVFLTCGDNRDWEPSDRYMLRSKACAEGGERRWVTQSGVTYCGQPKPDFKSQRQLEWHGVVYGRDEFNNCRLLKDANRFSKATYELHDNHALLVMADVAEVSPASGMAAAHAVTAAKAAVTVKKALPSSEFVALQQAQRCKLKNENWVYIGKSCKNGYAEGKGSAKDRQGLEFIGAFVGGERTRGEIHQNGKMIFSGSLVDDKPEGNAICLHEGEYEECRYFKGKRIDTLYKMRAEMAKQQSVQPAPSAADSTGGEITDYAVDALQQEAADRAADYIFDRFF